MAEKPVYTVLTTCPDYGSRNVGDKLIEVRLKQLLEREKGECRFVTIFREEPLENRLAEINGTRAILMPACPVRDTPMYPGTYRLVDDLSRIRVPMIPVGANWNVYPGDARSRQEVKYSDETVNFLDYIAGQIDRFSCREHFVCRVLEKHGVDNAVFTGDPAMFNLSCIGKPMKRPKNIEKLVFSPPLSAYYADQALEVIEMLADLFPGAQRYCAFHLQDRNTATSERGENSAALNPEVTLKNQRIREHAEALGYDIWDLAGRFERLRDYETCDLHVGYECHAHLYFLSARLPSVLIAEDARGMGFNYTLGRGGFTGFERSSTSFDGGRKQITSGYCTTAEELSLAPPRSDMDVAIRGFLEEEMENRFSRYIGLDVWLDETHEKRMRPFLQSLV
ncbi:MAG: polysaccharide pyruvyl transferase family protein [Candidatus Brocadiia bacterium]